LSSGDLTKLTNPDGGLRTFTYDGSGHLTRDQYGPNLEANYTYQSSVLLAERPVSLKEEMGGGNGCANDATGCRFASGK
jgi:hypothetical protein